MAENASSRARRAALLAAGLLAGTAHADGGHGRHGFDADRPRFEATFDIADRGGDGPGHGRDDRRFDDPPTFDSWGEQDGRNAFRAMPPDDQMRLRQTEQRYRQLSPEQQERLRRRWQQMDPEERARIRRQIEQRRTHHDER